MLGKLTEQETDEVFKRNVVGRIGCSDAEKTYVVPIHYVYDGRYIIGHSREGLKIAVMRKNPKVCFEVDEMPGADNWKSVIAWGTYEELTDEEDKYYAMKKMADRMMHLKVSETAKPPHLSENRVHPHQPGDIKVIVFRIVVQEKSGRFEKN
ncbi:MAG: pyridoxamine 5'-phosphate oxidase family protein [Chitinophagaceae bacterium]|nr:pyridoxamine 5'-phosphate oxidase family protein [Chitinophagaceae bacterium]